MSLCFLRYEKHTHEKSSSALMGCFSSGIAGVSCHVHPDRAQAVSRNVACASGTHYPSHGRGDAAQVLCWLHSIVTHSKTQFEHFSVTT